MYSALRTSKSVHYRDPFLSFLIEKNHKLGTFKWVYNEHMGMLYPISERLDFGTFLI